MLRQGTVSFLQTNNPVPIGEFMDSITSLNSLVPVDFDAGTVFSGTPSGTPVKGYAEATPYTPTMNPNYIFHEHTRDLIVWLIAQSFLANIYLI